MTGQMRVWTVAGGADVSAVPPWLDAHPTENVSTTLASNDCILIEQFSGSV
jgi:hypothetical protein